MISLDKFSLRSNRQNEAKQRTVGGFCRTILTLCSYILVLAIVSSSGNSATPPEFLWVKGANSPSTVLVTDLQENICVAGHGVTIAKFNRSGNLIWRKTFASSGRFFGQYNDPRGIAVDVAGNVYVTGVFAETMTLDGFTLTSSVLSTFVAKFSNSGTPLWMKQVTGDNPNI